MFSSDGNLVTTGGPGAVKVWEARTGKLLATLPAGSGKLIYHAFGQNGQILLVGQAGEKSVKVYDLANGMRLHETWFQHPAPIAQFHMNHDRSMILTASDDTTIRLWNAETGNLVGVPRFHSRIINGAFFSQDNRFAYTRGLDRMYVWDTENFEPQGQVSNLILCRGPGFKSGPEFKSSGLLISWGNEWAESIKRDFGDLGGSVIRGWKPKLGVKEKSLPGAGRVGGGSFDPSGCYLWTTSNEACLWHWPTGTPVRRLLGGGLTTFSPDGASFCNGLRMYDVAKATAFGNEPHGFGDVHYSPDGKWLALSSIWHLSLVDAKTGNVRWRRDGWFDCATFSRDSQSLLAGGGNGWGIWNVNGQGKPAAFFADERTMGMVVSPDGVHAFIGGQDGNVWKWNLRTQKRLDYVLQHGAEVGGMAISPDGNLLLVPADDGQARLWDVATKKRIGPSVPGGSAAFAPDSRRAATGRANVRPQSPSVWRIPEPAAEPVDRLVCYTQVATGVELDQNGSLQVMAVETWHQRKRRLAELGGPPKVIQAEYASSPPPPFFPIKSNVVRGSGSPAPALEGIGRVVRDYRLVGKHPQGSGDLYGAAMSSDGRVALSNAVGGWRPSKRHFADNPDPFVRVWDVAEGKEVQKLAAGRRSWGVALSPNREFALTGHDDDTACLWDIKTAKKLWTFHTGRSVSREVAFSPDGKIAAVCNSDTSIILVDVVKGTEIRRLPGHTGWIVSKFVFSRDGRRLISGGTDTTVRVWDVATGAELWTFDGHTAPVHGVDFLPGATRCLSFSPDRTMRLWDIEAGKELWAIKFPDPIHGRLAVSPDGRLAAVSFYPNTIRVLDLETRREVVRCVGHIASHVFFHPDGKHLLSAGADGELRLWNVHSWILNPARDVPITQGNPSPPAAPKAVNRVIRDCRPVGKHPDGTAGIWGAAISKDGRFALSGTHGPWIDGKGHADSPDSFARLWDIAKGKELKNLAVGPRCFGIALSPDGRFAFVGHAPVNASFWDLEAGKQLWTMSENPLGVPQDVAFSPDGSLVAIPANDGTRLLEAKTGKEVHFLAGHRGWMARVAFSPDGRRLASLSGEDKTIRVWDVASGKEILRLEGHTSITRGLAFLPKGGRIVTCGHDRTLRLWDIEAAKEVWAVALPDPLHWDSHLAVSPDGRLAAGSFSDNSIRIWDLETRQEVARCVGHVARRLFFLPDGKQLLSAGANDGTLRLWQILPLPPPRKVPSVTKGIPSPPPPPKGEVRTVKDHRLIGKHPGDIWIWGAALSRDGDRLLSGVGGKMTDKGLGDSKDRFVRLWDVAGGKEVKKLDVGPQCLALDTSPDKRFALVARHDSDKASYWDLVSGKEVWTFRCPCSVKDVALSPDGTQAAVAAEDGQVWLVDPKSGKAIKSLDAHESWIYKLFFLPDGRRLITCGNDQDKTLRLWDIASGTELRRFEGHIASRSVAFLPKDRMLSLGQADKTLRLWDLQAGKELWAVQADDDIGICVAVSPDGRLAATTSFGDRIRVWDLEARREVVRCVGHAASYVFFLPDGKQLLSAGLDGELRLWRIFP